MASPRHIHFDDSLWPLLIIRVSGRPTDEEFEACLTLRGAYLDRGQKQVLIYDTASLSVLTSEQRQWQIDWLKPRAHLLHQLLLGTAIIIPSPAMRLVLSVVRHQAQLRSPYHIASSMEEAAAWAAARLSDAGLVAEAQRVCDRFGLSPPRAQD